MDTPCVFCDHPKNKTNTNCAKCGRQLKPNTDSPDITSSMGVEPPIEDLPSASLPEDKDQNTNLFECKDCSNLCSKTAKTCPRCGCIFNSDRKSLETFSTKHLAIGAVVLVAVLLGGFYFLRPVAKPTDLSISGNAGSAIGVVYNVKGEVFITTQARDNVKLGGTLLTIYKKDEVKKVVSTKIQETISNPKPTLDFFTDIALLASVAAVQTDSDGKYSLDLPSGRYIVMVMDSRKVFDKTEFYHWLVRLDVNRDGIVLPINNSNMLPDDDTSTSRSPLYSLASEIY